MCSIPRAFFGRMRSLSPVGSLSLARVSVACVGPPEHVFLWYAQALILHSPLEKVAHCRECQTIFYRVKQQVHCSRACTNRVSQRRLRARVAATSVTTPVTIELQTTASAEVGVDSTCTRGAGGGRGVVVIAEKSAIFP